MKVLIIGGKDYEDAFINYDTDMSYRFAYMSELLKPDILEDIDLVCFTGGSDVNPELYGEVAHTSTRFNAQRDVFEANFFERVLSKEIPMVGICRGSQFLTVMNGGKLIQDVANHALYGAHQMCGILPPSHKYGSNQRWLFPVTSTHHQMMYPYNLPSSEYQVVGWAEGLSDKYDGLPGVEVELSCLNKTKDNDVILEPEVVFYPHTQCLAVQYHPEMMASMSTGIAWFHHAIRAYLF